MKLHLYQELSYNIITSTNLGFPHGIRDLVYVSLHLLLLLSCLYKNWMRLSRTGLKHRSSLWDSQQKAEV